MDRIDINIPFDEGGGSFCSTLHSTTNCPHVDSADSGGDDDDWLLVEVVSRLIYLFHGIDS